MMRSFIKTSACCFAALLVALWLSSLVSITGCKKKGASASEEAVARASAEYSCDDVQLLSGNGNYYKLDVCGKTRWYRCTKQQCGDAACTEVKKKKP